jgi:PAS domain S-box-containing protein
MEMMEDLHLNFRWTVTLLSVASIALGIPMISRRELQLSEALRRATGQVEVHEAERRAAEDEVRASEERLRLVIAGSNDGVWDWNPQTHEVYLSPHWEEVLGYAPGELPHVDSRFFDRLHPDDRRMVQEALDRHFAVHEPFDVESRLLHKDGHHHWIQARGEAAPDVDGQAIRMLGTITDIEPRKRAEAEVARSEYQLRQILDSLFGFVGLYTLDGVLIEANRAPLEAAGLSRDEVPGKPFWDIYWWNYDPEVQATLRDALDRAAKGEVVRYEPIIRVLEGRRIQVDVTFGPLRDAEGEIGGIVGFGVDITERKRVEKDLTESLREKETLLREVHHRVKNNLQIISSVLHFQAKKAQGSETEALFADVRVRLQSMLLVHDQLYQSKNFARIEFDEYVRNLVEELPSSFGVLDRWFGSNSRRKRFSSLWRSLCHAA